MAEKGKLTDTKQNNLKIQILQVVGILVEAACGNVGYREMSERKGAQPHVAAQTREQTAAALGAKSQRAEGGGGGGGRKWGCVDQRRSVPGLRDVAHPGLVGLRGGRMLSHLL